MSYGLEVKNGNGNVQINSADDGFQVYQLAGNSSAGTLTTNINNAQRGSLNGLNFTNSITTVTAANLTTSSIVLVRPTTNTEVTFAGDITGTNNVRIYSSVSMSFTVMIFNPVGPQGTGIPVPTSNYGLVVYDSTGNQTSSGVRFNGDNAALRIKSVLSNFSSTNVSTDYYASLSLIPSAIKTAEGVSNGYLKVFAAKFSNNRGTIAQTDSILSDLGNDPLATEDNFEEPTNAQSSLLIAEIKQ